MPRSVSNALVSWYRANKRDLPWRRIDDPYAILVSEVMLQQTQVATVLPYYERFMRLFPNPASLAAAEESMAMAAWAGLGYYRRLRNVRAAAEFVAQHGWPEDLRELPGVGRYTAGALGSIAFGEQIACADGNVRRVMSRLAGKTLSLVEAEADSSRRMGRIRARDWNQAAMELGALVCTPASPACNICPVATDCMARLHGTQLQLPAAVAKPSKQVEHVCACFIRGGRVALREAGAGEWWQGMLVFPFTPVGPDEDVENAVSRLGLRRARPLGSLRHTVTNHRIALSAFAGTGTAPGAKWYQIDELGALPLPSPQRRVAKWLAEAA